MNQPFVTSPNRKSRAQKRFKLDSGRRGSNSNEKSYDQLNGSSDVKSNDFEESEYTTLPKTPDKSFQRRSKTSKICQGFLYLCEKLDERDCVTILRLLPTSSSVLVQFPAEFETINGTCQRLKENNETSASYLEFEKLSLECKNSVSYTVYTSDATKVLRDPVSERFTHKNFRHDNEN